MVIALKADSDRFLFTFRYFLRATAERGITKCRAIQKEAMNQKKQKN